VRSAFKRTLIIALLAVVVIAAAFAVVRPGGAVPVETIVVSAPSGGTGSGGAGTTSVTANGYVVARTRASVSAKIPGRLASLTVDGGSVVKRGDIIARLDNADYQAAVAEAQANLATARAQVIEAESARDQAMRDSRRVQEIRSTQPELMSAQEAENASSSVSQTAARAAAAKARVDAARASLRLAQANRENTYIRAPFSGTVLRKEAEVGEGVAPPVGGGLTRGAVVAMCDPTTLEVAVGVRDGKLAMRPVDAGPVSAGFREIRRGLSGGEVVVTSALDSPEEGMRVNPTTGTS
jgi:multidrug efflux pump subunit AcrA (membrane-fusion protein)